MNFNQPAPRAAVGRIATSRRALLGSIGVLLVAARAARHDAAAGARPRHERKHHRRKQKQILAPPPDAAACNPASSSGITGLVLIGPMCPVMQSDVPCPDRPYATTLVVRDRQGSEICRTSSGADGRFRIGLPPGEYELGPDPAELGRLPYASPQPVTVLPGQYTEVLVSYDSGIR